MNQITITREEFRERISRNPREFGLLRAHKEDPEKFKSMSELATVLRRAEQQIVIAEIEEELFGEQEADELI